MQTSLETLGPLERRLNVAVPIATIESEIQKRLARLARTARVSGFRPGKVPMRMIIQQYGPQVRSDVISEAVQSGFSDAVREQNLRVAGYPRIEAKPATPGGEALEFAAIFEVYPDVRIGDLSAHSIVRPVAEVGPADVEQMIEVLRHQRARFEPVSRAAAPGDRVIVDFTGKIDGVEFPGGQARDFPILVGEGRMLPEFDAAVSGMSAGVSRSFGLTFPADYHGKEVAGRVAQFELTVKTVSAAILPPVDAEFARVFGIASGSIDELKVEIASNLRLELRKKIAARVKEQAFAALRETAELAVPRSLVDAEANGMAERAAAEMQSQGAKPEDVRVTPEMFRAAAEERVGLGLVVSEVVRTQGLSARPEQVKALVMETAQTYEQPEAVVRWHYEKPERLNEMTALALEHNVVEWVLSRARVEDKAVPLAELMAPASA